MAAKAESTELVPAPGNYGVSLVPAEAENTVAFEDTRLYDTGYGTFGKYLHPRGGVVTLLANRADRRLYQNKGFVFLGYCNSLAEAPSNPVPSYLGPQAKEISDAQINKQKGQIKALLESKGVTKEEVEATVAAIEARLRPREVPQGQTLPGELAAEGYNRGVPGLDPTMTALPADAPTEARAIPGGYVMNVPVETAPAENGENGEPIQPSQPALPRSRSSGTASTPAAPDPK